MKKLNRRWARGEGYVVVQVLLFALIIFGPRQLKPLVYWPRGLQLPLQILSGVSWLLGASLLVLGLVQLGKNLSALPHPKEEAQLVESGIFALVRHPIYGGLILLVFAWAVFETSLVMLFYAFMLVGFFELKSRREERALRQKFAAYSAYQARVRKFIPFIY